MCDVCQNETDTVFINVVIFFLQLASFQKQQMKEMATRRAAAIEYYRQEYEKSHPSRDIERLDVDQVEDVGYDCIDWKETIHVTASWTLYSTMFNLGHPY